jgi:hypothetical protein
MPKAFLQLLATAAPTRAKIPAGWHNSNIKTLRLWLCEKNNSLRRFEK